MLRQVHEWPWLPSSALQSHDSSSSKLKRTALNFLSSIRTDEEVERQQFESNQADFPTEQKAIDSNPPIQTPDLGGGVRMRGDAKASHVQVCELRTDKSHRFYLSADRAYPAMVFSLVIPSQSSVGNAKHANASKHVAGLGRPRPDGDVLDVFHDDSEASDSSSDEGSDDGARHGKKKHGRGVSFGWLLDSSFNAPSSGINEQRVHGGSVDDDIQQNQGAFLEDSPTLNRRKAKPAPPQDDSEDSIGPDSYQGLSNKRNAWDVDYSFAILDDSKIIQGKHRVVQNLPSARVSILPYIKTKVLKEEVNQLFRKQNPHLPEDLTLSKVRKMKKELLEKARNVDLELSTVALATVYLEKLILKGVVSKTNRKLIAFTCLVVAFKFNEARSDKMKALLADIERSHKMISAEDIFKIEFAVFSHLRFNINLAGRDYFEHFIRLMQAVEVSPSEYLQETHDDTANLLKGLEFQKKAAKEEESQRPRSSSSSTDSEPDHIEVRTPA